MVQFKLLLLVPNIFAYEKYDSKSCTPNFSVNLQQRKNELKNKKSL